MTRSPTFQSGVWGPTCSTMPAPSWPPAHEPAADRKVAGGDMIVGVAQAGVLETHQELALPGLLEIDLENLPLAGLLTQDGCLALHVLPTHRLG